MSGYSENGIIQCSIYTTYSCGISSSITLLGATTLSKMTAVPKLVPPNSYSNSPHISPEERNKLSELSKMIDPINENWADDGCLHRFLRATKWDVAKAATRIDNTGKWRREFGLDSILPEHVENVAEAGRQFLSGFDKEGRPIWYMIPARKSANHSVDDQIKFVVYTIEKAISLMPENVESLVIIIDYSDMSIFNAPSSGTGRKFLHILSEYYPERLGLAFIVNPTWYLWTFFTLLGPFLDPVTKAKIHLISHAKEENSEESKKHNLKKALITDYVEKDQLLKDYGGSHDFEWHFDTYWSHLNQ